MYMVITIQQQYLWFRPPSVGSDPSYTSMNSLEVFTTTFALIWQNNSSCCLRLNIIDLDMKSKFRIVKTVVVLLINFLFLYLQNALTFSAKQQIGILSSEYCLCWKYELLLFLSRPCKQNKEIIFTIWIESCLSIFIIIGWLMNFLLMHKNVRF